MRGGIPEKGDLRYPTLGGTIFVGVFLAMAAVLLSVLLDWGIWPYLAAGAVFLYLVSANLIAIRMNRHQERARAVLDRVEITRDRESGSQ